MKARPWRDLVVVLAVVAGLGALLGRPAQAPGPTPTPARWTPRSVGAVTLDGVSWGATRAQVEAMLGPAASQGRIQVGPSPQEGRYAEWGTRSAGLTWDGHPTVVFNAQDRVLSVVGRELDSHGEPLFALGAPRDIVRHALGPPDEEAQENSQSGSYWRYYLGESELNLTFEGDGRLKRMVMCAQSGRRPVRTPWPPGPASEDAGAPP